MNLAFLRLLNASGGGGRMHSLRPAPALGSAMPGAHFCAGAPLGGEMQWKHSEVLGAG